MHIRILFIITALLLSACEHITSPILGPIKSEGGHINPSGPHQLFNENIYETVNLHALLDPLNYNPASKEQSQNQSPDIDTIFANFYKRPNPALERNRIQDRIMAISEQRCSSYKFYLKRLETSQNIYSGGAATIFGGLGAIFSSLDASRIFSGLAGISSGLGAELKQGYFANAASSVIIPGIDLARKEIRAAIQSKKSKDIEFYSVQEALQDVSAYHDACSINTGLERAGKAVNQIENPGLHTLNDTLLKLSQTNLALETASSIAKNGGIPTEEHLRKIKILQQSSFETVADKKPTDSPSLIIHEIEKRIIRIENLNKKINYKKNIDCIKEGKNICLQNENGSEQDKKPHLDLLLEKTSHIRSIIISSLNEKNFSNLFLPYKDELLAISLPDRSSSSISQNHMKYSILNYVESNLRGVDDSLDKIEKILNSDKPLDQNSQIKDVCASFKLWSQPLTNNYSDQPANTACQESTP